MPWDSSCLVLSDIGLNRQYSSWKLSAMWRVNERHTDITSHSCMHLWIEWAIPAYSVWLRSITILWPALLSYPTEDRRLSWHGWLRWLVKILSWYDRQRCSPIQLQYWPRLAYGNFGDQDWYTVSKPQCQYNFPDASTLQTAVMFASHTTNFLDGPHFKWIKFAYIPTSHRSHTHIICTTCLEFFGHISHADPSIDHSRAIRSIVASLPVD